jgi:hypothetical protein
MYENNIPRNIPDTGYWEDQISNAYPADTGYIQDLSSIPDSGWLGDYSSMGDNSIPEYTDDGMPTRTPDGKPNVQNPSILRAATQIAQMLGMGVAQVLQLPEVDSLLSSVLAPVINNAQSAGYLKSAADMLKNSGNAFDDLQAPNLTALIPQLQARVQQGVLTPAQAEAYLQQASEMQNVQGDPNALFNARQNLAQLENIAANKGITQADQAQMDMLFRQAAAKAGQDRQAQIQALQQQGVAGGGAELAARLAGSQGIANAGADFGAKTAQNAQQRALAALEASLQGNTALNSQLFNQQAQKASAQDAINSFNTTARNKMAELNAANQQAANLQNFQMANEIGKENVATVNKQAMMPYQAAQEQYNNSLERAKAQATNATLAGGKLGQLANEQIARSNQFAVNRGTSARDSAIENAPKGSAPTGQQNTQQNTQQSNPVNEVQGYLNTAKGVYDFGKGIYDLASGVDWGSMASTIGDWFSDENLKTDKRELSDEQVDEMIGKLTGYKYRYKGSPNEQVGVMAQDLEKINPQSVVDTPAGKMVSGDSTIGTAMAMIANQNKRIKQLEKK